MDVDSDLWGSVNTIVSHRDDDDDDDDVDYYDTNVMTGGGIGEGDNIGAMPPYHFPLSPSLSLSLIKYFL